MHINDFIVSYLSDRVSEVDINLLQLHGCPSSSHEQILEALAIFETLREWHCDLRTAA